MPERILPLAMYRWGVELTPAEVCERKERAQAMMGYKDNKANLCLGGFEHKFIGKAGELAFKSVMDRLGIAVEDGTTENKPDLFDFKVGGKVYSLKIQRIPWAVKQSDPLFLNAKQKDNPCDFYVFIRANGDGTWYEILGEVEKEVYLRGARFLRGQLFDDAGNITQHGDIIQYGDNPNWEVKASCYSRRVSCLRPLSFIPLDRY